MTSQRRRLSLGLGIALGVVVLLVWWRVAGESAGNRIGSTRERNIEAEGRADETKTLPGTEQPTRHAVQESAATGLPSEKPQTAEPSSAGSRDFIVHVLDAGDWPVEGVHVRVEHSGGRAQKWTNSRGQARVVVQGTVEEVYVLHVLTPEQMEYLTPPPRRDLGMATEARFVLGKASLIEGTVLLGDEPLTFARIRLRSTDQRLLKIVRSDGEGRFRVKVPVVATVDLEVTGRWQLRNGRLGRVDDGYEGSVAGVRAGARNVILRAQRSARDRTVLVKAVDPEGAPIAQVKISSAALRASPKTDESGYVRLDGLPGHRVRLRATLDARDTELVAPEAIEVTPRGQEVVFRFVTGVRVGGIVANPDGSPAAGKVLKIRHKTGRATVTTDEAGRFRAYVFPAGEPVQVRVFEKDGKKLLARVKAIPGNESLSIQLQSVG